LLGKILGGLDRRLHALDGEKCRQIGRVRRNDDERKKPPDAADNSTGHRPEYTRQDNGYTTHTRLAALCPGLPA